MRKLGGEPFEPLPPFRSGYREVTVEGNSVWSVRVGHFITFSGSLVLMGTPLLASTSLSMQLCLPPPF